MYELLLGTTSQGLNGKTFKFLVKSWSYIVDIDNTMSSYTFNTPSTVDIGKNIWYGDIADQIGIKSSYNMYLHNVNNDINKIIIPIGLADRSDSIHRHYIGLLNFEINNNKVLNTSCKIINTKYVTSSNDTDYAHAFDPETSQLFIMTSRVFREWTPNNPTTNYLDVKGIFGFDVNTLKMISSEKIAQNESKFASNTPIRNFFSIDRMYLNSRDDILFTTYNYDQSTRDKYIVVGYMGWIRDSYATVNPFDYQHLPGIVIYKLNSTSRKYEIVKNYVLSVGKTKIGVDSDGTTDIYRWDGMNFIGGISAINRDSSTGALKDNECGMFLMCKQNIFEKNISFVNGTSGGIAPIDAYPDVTYKLFKYDFINNNVENIKTICVKRPDTSYLLLSNIYAQYMYKNNTSDEIENLDCMHIIGMYKNSKYNPFYDDSPGRGRDTAALVALKIDIAGNIIDSNEWIVLTKPDLITSNSLNSRNTQYKVYLLDSCMTRNYMYVRYYSTVSRSANDPNKTKTMYITAFKLDKMYDYLYSGDFTVEISDTAYDDFCKFNATDDDFYFYIENPIKKLNNVGIIKLNINELKTEKNIKIQNYEFGYIDVLTSMSDGVLDAPDKNMLNGYTLNIESETDTVKFTTLPSMIKLTFSDTEYNLNNTANIQNMASY